MEIRRLRKFLRFRGDGEDEAPPRFEAAYPASPGERSAFTIGSAAVRAAPGFVRPLAEEDMAEITALYSQIMPSAERLDPAVLRERLTRLLLQNPWRSRHLQSLVYQESGGRVAGCIGVMPRPMIFQNRPITAAVSHSFIVEPGSRPMLAALELARNFLAGPQDLSLAEAGRVSRKLWERAGGSVSLLYSLCWTRPLKPSRYALSFLRRRGLPSPLERALRPACNLLDRLAPLAGRSFRLSSPASYAAAGLASELDVESFCGTFAHCARSRALYPRYERSSADWLLQTLAAVSGNGDFHKVLVSNSQREAVGWYLYCTEPGGIATVMQMGARENSSELVFDHLCRHAREHGAIAVSGQVDPALFHVLAARDCLFHHSGGSSFLAHSGNPEIMQAIHRGDAFITRLEGEWWISFLLNRTNLPEG